MSSSFSSSASSSSNDPYYYHHPNDLHNHQLNLHNNNNNNTGAAATATGSADEASDVGLDVYNLYYDVYAACGESTVRDYRAAQLLTTVLYPVLVVLGVLGNGLSVAALAHLSDNAWSSCLYLAVLSAVEMVVLIFRCGGAWFMEVVRYNLSWKMMTSSDAMCKTYLFVVNVLQQMWPWLMVALSVELVISTRYPLKTYRLCTTERARATVLLITILLVCLNLNFFWTWGLDFGGQCMYIEVFSAEFLNIIWPSIEMSVKHLLPLVIATVSFLLSLASLLRASRGGAPSYEPILKRYFLDLRALQQLKQVALITVLLFLVVKTFTFVMELLNALIAREVIVVPCEHRPQFLANVKLANNVRDAVVYSFHSLKFFVYFALCASFRHKVLSILRKIFFCCGGGGGAKAEESPLQNGRKSRAAKDHEANRHFEQIEDHAAACEEGNGQRYYAAGRQDLNGHRPSVISKTTHV